MHSHYNLLLMIKLQAYSSTELLSETGFRLGCAIHSWLKFENAAKHCTVLKDKIVTIGTVFSTMAILSIEMLSKLIFRLGFAILLHPTKYH